MSSISEVSPSSFDSYEGIRIVIPGLVGFGVGLGAFATVAPSQDLGIMNNALVGVVAALVLGLFFYYWDIPARSAAYNENQPTDYLEKQFPTVKPFVLLTAYLLLLNTRMPSNTRNRSLYMGSMYRIGVEMILSLGVAVYVVFAGSLFNYGPNAEYQGHWPRIIVALALILAFGACLVVNYEYERRRPVDIKGLANHVRANLIQDLLRRSMWPYGIGLMLVIVSNLNVVIDVVGGGARGLAAAGLAICLGVWVFRYVRGVVKEGNSQKRVRLHSTTSGLLFIFPIVVSLVTFGVRERNIIGSVSLMTAWSAAACLVLATVVIRGHERKLHGVYRGQTRWLEENYEQLAEVLGDDLAEVTRDDGADGLGDDA